MLHLGDAAIWLGFATTVLIALWNKIKIVLDRVWGLAFVRIELQSDSVRAMSMYLWEHFRHSPPGRLRYVCPSMFVRPLKRYRHVGLQLLGSEPILFWKGRRPLLAGFTAGQMGEVNENHLVVSFVRGTFDPDELVRSAIDLFAKRLTDREDRGGRYFVRVLEGRQRYPAMTQGQMGEAKSQSAPSVALTEYATGGARLVGYRWDEVGADNSADRDPFDALAFPDRVIEAVEDVKHWKASEAWYRQRRIPWKRGLMFEGPPGNGKTSLARAIGQMLDMPVFVIDLATMDNHDLRTEWAVVRGSVPCIALFEDLDGVFERRKNVSRAEDGVTFDCLLNTIDGVEGNDGVLLIVTSNHPEKIDEAMMRPGRIDKRVMITEPDEAGRWRIARRILSDCPELAGPIVAAGKGQSASAFQEQCRKAALDHYWRPEKESAA